MSLFFIITNKKIANIKTINYVINSTIKCSTSSIVNNNNEFLQYGIEKDPGVEFIKPETQKLLKSITRIDLERIFRKRTVPKNTVTYKFMTTEEIQKEIKIAAGTAKKFLQMPPITKMQFDEHIILSKDPGIKNFSRSKFVFTDITHGIKDTERTIVIRQKDGTLENAFQDVRKRMIQLYFPKYGRTIRTPKVFEPEYLKNCLDEFKYEFILDRLCIQYEPYEKDYHLISSQVYLHLNESKKFNDLRSTRHFGPLAFFYAWHKIIDDLVLDMIKRDYLKNCVEIICLMYNLNSVQYDDKILNELNRLCEVKDSYEKHIEETLRKTEIVSTIGKSNSEFQSDDLCIEFIENYIKSNAIKKVQLELALQSYKEFNNEKKQLYHGLRKAHGIN